MSRDAFDDFARAAAEGWLEAELFPMALHAARLETTRARRVLEALRARDDVGTFEAQLAQGFFNASEARDWAEELGVVAVAIAVARWAGNSRTAREVREAVVLLARLSAFELSNARELRQDADDALYPHGIDPETHRREDRAEEDFGRWRALDAPVRDALFAWVKKLGAAISP